MHCTAASSTAVARVTTTPAPHVAASTPTVRVSTTATTRATAQSAAAIPTAPRDTAPIRTARAAAFLIAASLVMTSLLATDLAAQGTDPLTAGYPDDVCPSCAAWNEPQEPFRVCCNTYYVGTRGLAAILITSSDGHVLIDGGLPNSAPLILDNIRALGFDVEDVELILVSHPHFDHGGGIAAIQRASGARVAANPSAAAVLERGTPGRDDPQYGVAFDYPPIAGVERYTDGAALKVGTIAVMPHRTAGHTPGGATFTWTSCEAERCLNLVYADSQTPISADGFRFTDSDAYPGVLADFEHGYATLEAIPCDILLTPHPGASSLGQRLAAGPEGLVDPDACRAYATKSREQLRRRLEAERAQQ